MDLKRPSFSKLAIAVIRRRSLPSLGRKEPKASDKAYRFQVPRSKPRLSMKNNRIPNHDLRSSLPPGMRDEPRSTVTKPEEKVTVVFKKYSAESEGQYTELEIDLAPHGGNPLHYHSKYTETFKTISHELHLRTGREATPMTPNPGESKKVEKNQWDFFEKPTDECVKVRVKIEPANEGFEKMIYIVYGLSRDGLADEKAWMSRVDYKAEPFMQC